MLCQFGVRICLNAFVCLFVRVSKLPAAIFAQCQARGAVHAGGKYVRRECPRASADVLRLRMKIKGCSVSINNASKKEPKSGE